MRCFRYIHTDLKNYGLKISHHMAFITQYRSLVISHMVCTKLISCHYEFTV